MQGSRYHLFKFKLKLQKLSFFYLIILFFCSCHICTYLFSFYTSVTLLPAPFTSFFILHTLLFLLYFFPYYLLSFLSSFLFPFFPSLCVHLSSVTRFSIFFIFFPISFAVYFHSFFSFSVPSFFSFRSYLFFIYVLLILFSFLVSFVLSAPLFRPYFQYSV